jgi:acyl-coenzyme A synthetase/AMP-(fatty) acid ligase
MSKLILFTSGSTSDAKEVIHDREFINERQDISVELLGLTKDDIVLNVIPFNVIGYHVISAGPANRVGATLIQMNFDPYAFIRVFNQYRPTVIALIPKMIELISHTKGFDTLDMSCVRHLIMGSQDVPEDMISMLRAKGVQTIQNWYGSTENPPPVFVATNGTKFDFRNSYGYQVGFDQDGLLYVNGESTGDVFNLETQTYSHRLKDATKSTWKS